MSSVPGIYRNGKVVLGEPVDWPEGVQVSVVCENGGRAEPMDVCVDGSYCEDTPEAIQRWIEWFDALTPVFAGEELERFEAEMRSAREEQRALLPKWQDRIDRLKT